MIDLLLNKTESPLKINYGGIFISMYKALTPSGTRTGYQPGKSSLVSHIQVRDLHSLFYIRTTSHYRRRFGVWVSHHLFSRIRVRNWLFST